MSYSLCGNVGVNTGAISCDVRRGLPKILMVGGAEFAPSDYASQATIQAAIKARIQRAAGSSDKLFSFPEIQGNTDQTDADKIGTLGYGLKVVLLQGKPGYVFTTITGSTQEKALRKFNNKTVPVFVFDDGGNLWGTVDSEGNYFGCNCLISVKGKGFDDANNAKTTDITISFINASDFYDDAAFVQTTFGISDLAGLVDATLSEISAHTAGVFHVKATIPTTQLGVTINPYSRFADAMASASLWTAESAGTTIPITSVAKNTAGLGWDVTLDSTAYTALASGAKISIGWVDPATLAAAGVTDTEAPEALIVTK